MKRRQPKALLGKSEAEEEPKRALAQLLQEELSPIEPPPDVRDDIFQRILQRTASAMRAWRVRVKRPKDRLHD